MSAYINGCVTLECFIKDITPDVYESIPRLDPSFYKKNKDYHGYFYITEEDLTSDVMILEIKNHYEDDKDTIRCVFLILKDYLFDHPFNIKVYRFENYGIVTCRRGYPRTAGSFSTVAVPYSLIHKENHFKTISNYILSLKK